MAPDKTMLSRRNCDIHLLHRTNVDNAVNLREIERDKKKKREMG